jgi:hypothetical protein
MRLNSQKVLAVFRSFGKVGTIKPDDHTWKLPCDIMI